MALKEYFSNAQMQLITGEVSKVKSWDEKTIMKSVVVKFKGGERTLDFVRKHIAPLPSTRTVQTHFENLKLKPGILCENIEVLKHQVAEFSASQCRFGLYVDEKALIPGESYDPTTKEYIGKVTLPPTDEHATNVTVFLTGGIELRLKMPTAYHFTGKSNTGEAQAKFLIELIKFIEQNSPVKIDFIVFDLGPTNVSMLKNLDNSIGKGSKKYWIEHPCDSNRRLYTIPDLEHCTKNIIAGLRNHNITIPNSFVEKYSLTSSQAKITDVEALCKSQAKFDFKASNQLTDSIINPDHFSKMKSHTFEALMKPEVVTSLELFDQIKRKRGNEKVNATAFLLARIDQWHQLTSQGHLHVDDEDFLDKKKFLIESANLFDQMSIGNRHNICQSGALWGTLAFLDLTEFYCSIGMPLVKPALFLNNCIENFFSILASKQIKPSAVHATAGIKSISISKFLNDPISGSYNWEKDIAESDFSILTLLREKKKIEITSEANEIPSTIHVPSVILIDEIFDHDFEHQTFYCFIFKIFNKIFEKNKCDACYDVCVDDQNIHENYHKLQDLKLSKDNPLVSPFSQTTSSLRPSKSMEIFFFQLEFIYSELLDIAKSPEVMKTLFLNEVCGNQLSFVHCASLENEIIENFINIRLKLVHELRLVHRKSRFASKSLQN